MSPLGHLPNPLARIRSWPIDSQLGARRNAMIASTALATRRAERQDVEAFFASLQPQEAPDTGPLAVRR